MCIRYAVNESKELTWGKKRKLFRLFSNTLWFRSINVLLQFKLFRLISSLADHLKNIVVVFH